MTKVQAQALSTASEYREAMILVGIHRGLQPEDAIRFADQCVAEQRKTEDEAAIRRKAAAKLRR
jgi:hypothetical protein